MKLEKEVGADHSRPVDPGKGWAFLLRVQWFGPEILSAKTMGVSMLCIIHTTGGRGVLQASG